MQTQLKPGTQIAYVPTHAEGNLSHTDVQFGFVTSVKEDAAFCRYFTKKQSDSLRTLANSELTPFENIVITNHHLQGLIDQLVFGINKQEDEQDNNFNLWHNF